MGYIIKLDDIYISVACLNYVTYNNATMDIRRAHIFGSIEDCEAMLATCNIQWRSCARICKIVVVRAYTVDTQTTGDNGRKFAYPIPAEGLNQVDVA